MSWPEVTYDFYSGNGGSATNAEFATLLPAAERTVTDVCWPNVPDDGDADQQSAAKKAVCAAISVDIAYGSTHGISTGSGGSVSIGSFSYNSGGSSAGYGGAYATDMHEAIRRELVGTGLLNQVIA